MPNTTYAEIAHDVLMSGNTVNILVQLYGKSTTI